MYGNEQCKKHTYFFILKSKSDKINYFFKNLLYYLKAGLRKQL